VEVADVAGGVEFVDAPTRRCSAPALTSLKPRVAMMDGACAPAVFPKAVLAFGCARQGKTGTAGRSNASGANASWSAGRVSVPCLDQSLNRTGRFLRIQDHAQAHLIDVAPDLRYQLRISDNLKNAVCFHVNDANQARA
jgi:hypothetical protein